jgi:murein hydrolase activator
MPTRLDRSAFAGLAVVLLVAAAAPRGSLDQTRAKLDAAEQGRAAALSEQQTAIGRARSAVAEAALLTAAREAAEARLREAQQATAAAAAKMQFEEETRRVAAQEVERQSEALEPLLPVLERLARYPAETMLAVELPPPDAIRGVSILHIIAGGIALRAAELRKEQARLKATREELAAEAPALNAAETAQSAAAADLARQIALAEAAQRNADAQAAVAGRRAAQLAAEAASLRALLSKLEDAEIRRQKQMLRRKAMLEVPLRAPSRLLTPLSGVVIRNFGAPTDVGPAAGVSYRADAGARVIAPCGGRVLFAAPFRSYGQLMILDCGGGTALVLAGFGRFEVKPGATVAQGAVVGEMPPGKPVLYFELRREGEPVDPSSWLKSTS